LSVTLTTAVSDHVEVGLKTTEIKQFALGASDFPQLLVPWNDPALAQLKHGVLFEAAKRLAGAEWISRNLIMGFYPWLSRPSRRLSHRSDMLGIGRA